jgi:hypothetical protein
MEARNSKAVKMFSRIVSRLENKVFPFKYILAHGMSPLCALVSYTNKLTREEMIHEVVDHLSKIEIQDHLSLEFVKTFVLF